jgi:hypothetical protein
MVHRIVLASIAWGALALGLVLNAQETPKVSSDGAQIKEKLSLKEQILARQFQEFEQQLLRLKQRLERSAKQEERDQAVVLDRVLEYCKEKSISVEFEQMVDILKGNELKSLPDIKQALTRSSGIAEKLTKVIEMLREDTRSKAIQDETKSLKKLIEDLDRVIQQQQIVQAVTDRSKTDPKELKKLQENVTNETAKIAQQLAGKTGDPKNSKGDPKASGKNGDKAGEAKGDNEKNDKNDKTAGNAESKEGGDGKEPKGSAKSGDGFEGKEGKGKEGGESQAKGGKGPDGKDGDGKEGKGSEGAQAKEGKGGDSPKGEPKAGGEKSGDSGQAKGGEKKAGDKGGAQAKGGEGKSKESKAGAEGSQAKGGEGKGGEGKEGGKGGEAGKSGKSGKAQAKSGESSKGQGQAKDSGEPKEGPQGPQGPQGQAKDGGQKKGGPQGPQDNVAKVGKKEVEQGYDKQQQAEKDLEQAKNDDASGKQGEAIEKLEQAKKELEKLLRQLREEELERILAALQARCEKMLAMQKQVLAGTEAVAKAVEANADKQPDRNNKQDSLKLSDNEGDIVVEATKAIDILEAEGSAIAFPEVFQQVREDMKHVQRRLGVSDVAAVTQEIERDIIASLEDMIKALKKQRQDNKSDPSDSKPGQPPPAQDQKLIEQIAELKMIRSLQVRVNNRTQTYGKMYQGEQAAEAGIRRELQDLSGRQERIFEITNRIAKGDNR